MFYAPYASSLKITKWHKRHGFIMCGTVSVKNLASWYKSYGTVGFVSTPTYKKCYAGTIFEFCCFTEDLLTVQHSACEPTTQHNTTTHNNQNEPPPPYPPAALPFFSMGRAVVPLTCGAAASHGPMQGACHWVRWRHGFFPCLGCQCEPHQKIEREAGSWT